MLARTLLALTLCVAAASAVGAPANAAGAVQITRVFVNTPGPDLPVTNARLNAEYVTIKNTSGGTKSLTGFTVRDESNHVYRFGEFRLAKGASVKVHTGRGTNTATNRYMNRGYYIWNNTGGDSATLKSSGGATLDRCAWKSADSYVNC